MQILCNTRPRTEVAINNSTVGKCHRGGFSGPAGGFSQRSWQGRTTSRMETHQQPGSIECRVRTRDRKPPTTRLVYPIRHWREFPRSKIGRVPHSSKLINVARENLKRDEEPECICTGRSTECTSRNDKRRKWSFFSCTSNVFPHLSALEKTRNAISSNSNLQCSIFLDTMSTKQYCSLHISQRYRNQWLETS